jgi:hypothetical protein
MEAIQTQTDDTSFEAIREILRDLAKRQEETDRQLKERAESLDRQMKETDK